LDVFVGVVLDVVVVVPVVVVPVVVVPVVVVPIVVVERSALACVSACDASIGAFASGRSCLMACPRLSGVKVVFGVVGVVPGRGNPSIAALKSANGIPRFWETCTAAMN